MNFRLTVDGEWLKGFGKFNPKLKYLNKSRNHLEISEGSSTPSYSSNNLT